MASPIYYLILFCSNTLIYVYSHFQMNHFMKFLLLLYIPESFLSKKIIFHQQWDLITYFDFNQDCFFFDQFFVPKVIWVDANQNFRCKFFVISNENSLVLSQIIYVYFQFQFILFRGGHPFINLLIRIDLSRSYIVDSP